MKRSKNSNNRKKHHRGPKERRWKRRRQKQAPKAKRYPPRVGSNGKRIRTKRKRYEAPASFEWSL